MKEKLNSFVNKKVSIHDVISGTINIGKNITNSIYTFSLEKTVDNIRYKHNEYMYKKNVKKLHKLRKEIINTEPMDGVSTRTLLSAVDYAGIGDGQENHK